MSFFERAKAAATDLAAKADAAMANSGMMPPGSPMSGGGGGERALRDFGVLAYLEATGRAVDPAQKAQVMQALSTMEQAGQLGPLTVGPPPPAPGSPPPPPGAMAAQAAPPPPAQQAPPAPSPPVTPPAAPAQQAPPATPASTPPPPPPPSWAG